MPSERELPFSDPHIDYRATQLRRQSPNVRTNVTPNIERLWDTTKPQSLLEAIMCASPADTIDWNNNRELVIESVAACVDALSEEHKFVIEAIFYERASYSELGDRLGCSKPHAWRITQAALRQLTQLVRSHPTLKGIYMRPSTWEEAAADWVRNLSENQQEPYPIDVDNPIRMRDMMVRTYNNSGKVGPMGAFKGIAFDAIGHLRTMGSEGWDDKHMIDLLTSKQRDYGHGNINAFGMYGILVRLSDKIERLKNLMANDREPANESFRDTLLDMVGYCVIAHMLDDDTFSLPLGDTNG